MRWRFRLIGLAAGCLAVLLATTGCGTSKVKVTGKLVKDGQPFKPDKNTLVTLTFAPEGEAADQTHPAKFNYDSSTYEVDLPPGRYKANCVIQLPDNTSGKAPPKVISSPQLRDKVHDLTSNKELDLEVGK
jgi:hypothetical protein